MLELWIDGKKIEASDVKILYTNKGGERTEIKISTEGDDGLISLKCRVTFEIES